METEKEVASRSDFPSRITICKTSSGFRSGYRTETALLEVAETIHETLDQGSCEMLVLLDLSAAFDMVSHRILLNRLEHLGVTGTVLVPLISQGSITASDSPPPCFLFQPPHVWSPSGLSSTLFNVSLPSQQLSNVG